MLCSVCGFDEFYGAHNGLVCTRCGHLLLRESRNKKSRGCGGGDTPPRSIVERVSLS